MRNRIRYRKWIQYKKGIRYRNQIRCQYRIRCRNRIWYHNRIRYRKGFRYKKESDIEKELDIRIEFSIKKELLGFENKSDLETNPSQIWKKWMTPMGFPGSNQDLLVSEKSHTVNCYLFFAKVVIKSTNLQTC